MIRTIERVLYWASIAANVALIGVLINLALSGYRSLP